jgi:hypothetical protein
VPECKLLDNYKNFKENNITSALLFACSSELIFDVESTFPGYPEYTVQQLIDRFSIYVSSDSTKSVKLLFPKVLRRILEKSNIIGFNMLKSINMVFVDKGKALEAVTEAMIKLRANFKAGKVPIENVFTFLQFRQSCLSNLMIGPVSSVQIASKITANTSNETYRSIFLTNENEDVLLTLPPKSPTMDISFLFQIPKLFQPRKQLAIQCKNVNSGFDIKSLNEEISKVRKMTSMYYESSQSNIEHAHMLFVIILTGEGTKDIESLRGPIFRSTSSELTSKGISLPNYMELLILTNIDMELFFGTENLKALRSLSV